MIRSFLRPSSVPVRNNRKPRSVEIGVPHWWWSSMLPVVSKGLSAPLKPNTCALPKIIKKRGLGVCRQNLKTPISVAAYLSGTSGPRCRICMFSASCWRTRPSLCTFASFKLFNFSDLAALRRLPTVLPMRLARPKLRLTPLARSTMTLSGVFSAELSGAAGPRRRDIRRSWPWGVVGT